MYSGLPEGLSFSDIDSDVEECDHVVQNETVEKHVPESSFNGEEEADSGDTEDCIPGVPLGMWQKFKELKRKNQEMKMKVPKVKRRRSKKHKKGDNGDSPSESEKRRKVQDEREEHWKELQQYFNINERFEPPRCSRPQPKTGLEKSIDQAIKEGNIDRAEELSESLATRELAVKITKATDCRDFVKSKQEAEALGKAHKKREQVAWGFEAKRRWETKSNMGYM